MCADLVAAKVAELLRPLLQAPGAVARFARAGLLPETILAATGFSGLLAGRNRLAGTGRLSCCCKALHKAVRAEEHVRPETHAGG